VKWDFSPTGGDTAGTYDFQALAAHEISEVLAGTTGLDSTKPNYATMFDLLRYSAPHVSVSRTPRPLFLVNGGVTNLGQFNITGGGDRSDLNGIAGDAQDAYLSTGDVYGLSPLISRPWMCSAGARGPRFSGDAKIGDAILSVCRGMAAVPEPSTWVIMLLASPHRAAVRRSGLSCRGNSGSVNRARQKRDRPDSRTP